MSTSEVFIQFNSYNDLREFMGVIETQFYEVSYTKFSLKCQCTEENVNLAVEQYNARVTYVN